MMGGIWQRDTIAWLIVASALPAGAAAVGLFGLVALWHIMLSLAVIVFWQMVFLWTRAQPVSPIAFVTAITVGVLAQGDFSPWQIVLAVSFGTVICEQIFGGWGRNVVNAAVAALAFLFFAFPQTGVSGGGALLALAVLPGAAMLMAAGIASWQVLAGALLGVAWGSAALGADPTALLHQGSLVFGLIFLVADPVASSATRAGRWVYGLIAGGALALFGWTDAGFEGPQAIIFSTLVASLFAPLIDAIVIALTRHRWRPSNG